MDDVLEIAPRHVIERLAIVQRQRALVGRLRSQGRDPDEAERLLQLFGQSLTVFEDHSKAIERISSRGPRVAKRTVGTWAGQPHLLSRLTIVLIGFSNT